ncbi:hypothetical protein SteCoe_7971 [Stentor coeruleus]|uniref:Saposin B-type domain-containing protein n=1 Tax=Stentor coeruleus TaxID=5963 RepID=A0A1R2CLB2_9CILI|nr:hypothetical protein SteCoe_7971 [Stentor coeruleus]
MAIAQLLFLSLLSLTLSSELRAAGNANEIILGSNKCWLCTKIVNEDAKMILEEFGFDAFIDTIRTQCYTLCFGLYEPTSVMICDAACYLVINSIADSTEEDINSLLFGDLCANLGYCPKENGEAVLTSIYAHPSNVIAGANVNITSVFTVIKTVSSLMIETKIITPDYYEWTVNEEFEELEPGNWYYTQTMSTKPSKSIPIHEGDYRAEMTAYEGTNCLYSDNCHFLFKGHATFHISKTSY